MTVAGLTMLAAAAVLGWILDRGNIRRFRQMELEVDQNYALFLRNRGVTAEEIAVELGRTVHQVSDWLDADFARSDKIVARIVGTIGAEPVRMSSRSDDHGAA